VRPRRAEDAEGFSECGLSSKRLSRKIVRAARVERQYLIPEPCPLLLLLIAEHVVEYFFGDVDGQGGVACDRHGDRVGGPGVDLD
jgi:hypothetical protein